MSTGIAHGAFDALWAKATNGRAADAPFYLGYVAIAAAMATLWWFAPLLWLVVFLLASIHHFGAADALTRTRWAEIPARGGALIVLGAAVQPEASATLYAPLLRGDAHGFVGLIGSLPMLIGWATLTMIALAELARDPRPITRAALAELTALCLAAGFAPPLLAFAAFFALSHAPRHLLRVAERVNPTAPLATALSHAARGAALILGLSLISSALLIALAHHLGPHALIAVAFVGLASLSLPHAWIVDRSQ
jgi:beta-carotene 15,15'-dioxygenase